MRRILCVLVVMLLGVGARADGDPFAGKWRLDVQQSSYPGGTCPVSMTIEMESVGAGVHYRSDAIYGNGREVQAEYTANYEGNQAVVMGARGLMLPVFLKRLNAHTVVASYTKDLVVVATSRRVISDDASTMTITTDSKDPSGKSVRTIGVFVRQ